jgi:glycosyltransferase involved in cell wall biosynthesis
MKLLIARSNFFSYSETFIDQQIRQLNPHAVLYEGWQPSNIHAGGSIYPFPLNLLIFRGSLRNLFPTFYQKIYTYFLKKYLQKTETTCLLANYGPMGTHIFTACQELHMPFVVHFHGFDASEKKTIARYGEEYRKVLPLAKAVIVVSQVMKMDIEGICGPLKNLHVLPYGVDAEKFIPRTKASKESIQLISVGRFTAKKAPIMSIKAFQILLEKFPTAYLTMIGDGELWEEAKKYVEENGLEKNVDFMGQQKPDLILEKLQKADIFIQHSIKTPSGDSEGTPNSILEASSCGLPIVSTIHAGIPEAVIQGVTGILVQESDFKAMGNALISLAEDPKLRLKMGESARNHMLNNYEIKTQAEKLKGLLQ